MGEHVAGDLGHRGPHEDGVVLQGLSGILEGQAAQVGQDSRGLTQLTFVAEPFPVSSGARHGPPSSSSPRGARETSPAGTGPTPPRLPPRQTDVDTTGGPVARGLISGVPSQDDR